jgi:hypothetical protein
MTSKERLSFFFSFLNTAGVLYNESDFTNLHLTFVEKRKCIILTILYVIVYYVKNIFVFGDFYFILHLVHKKDPDSVTDLATMLNCIPSH